MFEIWSGDGTNRLFITHSLEEIAEWAEECLSHEGNGALNSLTVRDDTSQRSTSLNDFLDDWKSGSVSVEE